LLYQLSYLANQLAEFNLDFRRNQGKYRHSGGVSAHLCDGRTAESMLIMPRKARFIFDLDSGVLAFQPAAGMTAVKIDQI